MGKRCSNFGTNFHNSPQCGPFLVRISLEIILLLNSCFFVAQFEFHVKKSGVQHCTCARLYLAILFLYIPDSGFVLVMSEACKLGNV